MTEVKTDNVTLFVLDDDLETHEQMKFVFDREGITDYTFFTDPEEFLKAFTCDTCVAIIDYLLMSSMNGLEVVKRVLNINKGCFIIIVSGQTNAQVVGDAINLGAKYLDKNRKGYLTQLIEYTKTAIEGKKKEIELMKSIRTSIKDHE